MIARIPAMATLMAIAPAGTIADVICKTQRKKDRKAAFKSIYDEVQLFAQRNVGVTSACAATLFGPRDQYTEEAVETSAALVYDAIQSALRCDCVWKRQPKSDVTKRFVTHVLCVIEAWCDERGITEDDVMRHIRECERRVLAESQAT